MLMTRINDIQHINYFHRVTINKVIDKVCQDYSYSHIYESDLSITVDCNGNRGQ
jgi:hypothetical protein